MSYLFLILSTLIWSGNFVLSRGMHTSMPPLALSFWRWLVAFVILLLVTNKKFISNKSVIKANFKFLLVQALLGVAGFNTLLYIAMQSTTAINAVLVNSSIPVLIAVISWFMHKEKLSVIQFLGILISFSGVIYLMLGGNFSTFDSLKFNKGDIFVLFAALTWAFYSVNLKRYPKDLDPVIYLFSITAIGLIFIFPMYVVEIIMGRTFEINIPNLLTITYVGIFASVLAFIFWNRAVRDVGANKSGPFIHLMPVFSIIMAIFFLGEKLKEFHIYGMLLIFFGIFLTTFKFKKKFSSN